MTSIELPYVHAFVDRHGRPRYYFRHKGRRWKLLAPTDRGFRSQYDGFVAQFVDAPVTKGANVVFLPGSLGWAIEKFTASPEFAKRAEGTRQWSRHILDELRRRYGAGLLTELEARDVKRIRNELRQAFATSTADRGVSLISVVWDYVDEHLDEIELGANPTLGVHRVHEGTKEHEPWPDELIARFDAVAAPKLRLARLLAFYSGQRRSDLVQMKWTDLVNNAIAVRQQKTDEPLTIPCHRTLAEALAAAPRTSDYILPGLGNQALTAEGLSNAVRKTLKKLNVGGFSVHGWRKNAGVALAEAGCTEREIMAILGHRTHAQSFHYTKRANQKRQAEAAIEKWENSDASGKPKNRKAF
jgi:integrase